MRTENNNTQPSQVRTPRSPDHANDYITAYINNRTTSLPQNFVLQLPSNILQNTNQSTETPASVNLVHEHNHSIDN